MMLFLDCSALIARYFQVPGSQRVRSLIAKEQDEGCAISNISVLAFVQVIRSMMSEGTDQNLLLEAMKAFHEDLSDLVRFEVDPCIEEAGRLALRHQLENEPAVQLAAALRIEAQLEYAAPMLGAPLVKMVTLDPKLKAAAKAEGLGV